VVKYGGSAITHKDKFESVNKASLSTSAAQMAMAMGVDNQSPQQWTTSNPLIVIVHGAGSFGHFHAKEYSLKTGGDLATWKKGLALTRQSVVKLNGIVVNEHIEKGLPVVGVPLFPQVRCFLTLNSFPSSNVICDASPPFHVI
jgi:isopentenyl phosphate kinase